MGHDYIRGFEPSCSNPSTAQYPYFSHVTHLDPGDSAVKSVLQQYRIVSIVDVHVPDPAVYYTAEKYPVVPVLTMVTSILFEREFYAQVLNPDVVQMGRE